MDLLYAMRDLGVVDPAADSTGEETGRTALGEEIDAATAGRPGRARRTRPGLLAGASVAVVASATTVTLLVSAAASPPPAFAVTQHQDGSASLKINRPTSLAAVNRKLTAMGIARIDKRTMAAGDDLSSIPNCSSIPTGWKGIWVQIAPSGSTATDTSTTVWTGAPGTWHLVMCKALNPSNTSSGTTGNTGSGNTGTTGDS